MRFEVFCLLVYLYAGFCMFLTQKKSIEEDSVIGEPGQKLFAAAICFVLWPLYPIVHWLFGEN